MNHSARRRAAWVQTLPAGASRELLGCSHRAPSFRLKTSHVVKAMTERFRHSSSGSFGRGLRDV